MKSKTDTENTAGGGCSSHDLLAVGRPPSRLPNGKENPEYKRWYRAKYPEKYAKLRDKWQSVRKKKEINEGRCEETQCKCVECGMVYGRTESMLDGFRYLRGNRYLGICNFCG